LELQRTAKGKAQTAKRASKRGKHWFDRSHYKALEKWGLSRVEGWISSGAAMKGKP